MSNSGDTCRHGAIVDDDSMIKSKRSMHQALSN